MITSLEEIQNKEFNRSFRGYDKEEVEEFLEIILEGYEELYKENVELKDRVKLLTEQISKYDGLEETLKSTLIMAQSTADDVRKAARKKSELIIEDAEIKAKEELWKSELKVEKAMNEYNTLKNEMMLFRNKYMSFLEAQLASVEELAKMEEEKFKDFQNFNDFKDMEFIKDLGNREDLGQEIIEDLEEIECIEVGEDIKVEDESQENIK